MTGKEFYKIDPDGWWKSFWTEVGKKMSCFDCPYESEDCNKRGCGTVLADRFLQEHSEGQYEW